MSSQVSVSTHKTPIHRLIIAFMVLALLTGCAAPSPVPPTPPTQATAPPQSTPNTPSAPGTIRFIAPGGPAQLQAYTNLAAAYSQAHPGESVEVAVLPGPADYRERLRADFAAGSAADVMIVDYLDFASLASRGLLETLQPQLDASTVISETGFYPQVLAPFRWDRRLVCIPQDASGLAVFYNRGLFAQAGLPDPKPDWNWDDFTAAAKTLTRDTDADGHTDQYGLGLEPGLTTLAPFIWQNRGDIVEEPGWPRRLLLDQPLALQAADWYASLQTGLHAAPDAEAESAQPSLDRFTSGQMAMYLGGREAVPALRQAAGFDWDVAPIPANHGRHSNVLLAAAYCLSAASSRKEAAWRFIEYAASLQGSAVLTAAGFGVPALRAAAESDAFLAPSGRPAHSQVFLDALRETSPLPAIENWPDIQLIVDDEIARAYYGRTPVADAMSSAVKRAEEYFKIHQTP
jgi:multiple sugar transport system substrate-binding protein